MNDTFVNNISMAAAIVLTGNQYNKINLFCKAIGLSCISSTTFYSVQKLYINPAVEWWLSEMQREMFKAVGKAPVIVSGDGRNDSPGHSAQYCTYTLMENTLNYVLHIENVDKRETSLKSPNMEQEACKRALTFLMKKIKVVELVTDAHPQILALLGMYIKLCILLNMLFDTDYKYSTNIDSGFVMHS
jgi:hypothetical protein